MSKARRFAHACVASPHHLASSVGLGVLASGGNALDAAIATNLTLGVVTPYLCGFGGDLFAIVAKEGRIFAYNGSGRAPAAATVEAVRHAASTDRMPERGPHSVTVPGAVEAWFALLDRLGSMGFSELAAPSLGLAREGFPLSEPGAKHLAGELVIGAEVAKVQAESRGHDIQAELALYVIHGLLHLCGHDDKTAEGAAAMRERERHYLQALGLPDIAEAE